MARNPRNTAAATANGAGGTAGTGGANPLSLAEVQKQIETANEQRTASITALQTQRTSHVNSISEIDTMLSTLGVETDAPRRGRRRAAGTRRASGGGTGPRGKRDPLGLKGYIARALLKAGTNGMSGKDLTGKIGDAGWANASAPTFNTQVYQVAGRMVKAGVIKSPGRGIYAPNAKTQKFLDGIQEANKAKAAA